MDYLDTIKILYCDSYGNFILNEHTILIYKIITNNNYNTRKRKYYNLDVSLIKRHDPFLFQIYESTIKLGTNILIDDYPIKIKIIPKIYENYYVIDNFNGSEIININYELYFINEIKKIMINNNGFDSKIHSIKNIFELYSSYKSDPLYTYEIIPPRIWLSHENNKLLLQNIMNIMNSINPYETSNKDYISKFFIKLVDLF